MSKISAATEKSDVDEKPTRRSTRVAAVVGIVVVWVTLCITLLRFNFSIMKMWPISGELYYATVWIVVAAPLAICISLLWDMIAFLAVDLKRYDVAKHDYSLYDYESDIMYSTLIIDVKFYGTALIGIICVDCLVNYFIVNSTIDWELAFLIITAAIFIVVQIIAKRTPWRNADALKKIKRYFKETGRLFMVLLIIFGILFTRLSRQNYSVDVTYRDDGIVIIECNSRDTIPEISVDVYGKHDKLNGKNYNNEYTLSASAYSKKEEKNATGDAIAKSVYLEGMNQYMLQTLDLNDDLDENGRYTVIINARANDRSAELRNEFEKIDDRFIFCRTQLTQPF